jgi:hypothetical protein
VTRDQSHAATNRRSVHARTYRHGASTDHDGEVAELHWSDGRSVQISSFPNENGGVLIRVWPENGTAEYGGHNLTSFSAALKFSDDGGIEVESLDVRSPWERHRV